MHMIDNKQLAEVSIFGQLEREKAQEQPEEEPQSSLKIFYSSAQIPGQFFALTCEPVASPRTVVTGLSQVRQMIFPRPIV